jgi:hypothetical protein
MGRLRVLMISLIKKKYQVRACGMHLPGGYRLHGLGHAFVRGEELYRLLCARVVVCVSMCVGFCVSLCVCAAAKTERARARARARERERARARDS